MPNTIRPTVAITKMVIAKLRLPSSRRLMIGSLRISSQMTSATSDTAAMSGGDHDRRAREPVVPLAAVEGEFEAAEAERDQGEAERVDMQPALQLLLRSFSRASGSPTKVPTRNSDRMPTGTLIRKIQCQPTWSVIQPPSVGPSTGPTTTTMP